MALTLENEFVVEAPIHPTWELLLDLGRVAQCLPGATIEPTADDDVYRGTMRVKLGPIAMNYQGTAQVMDLDPTSHRATFRVSGKETRGAGTASAIITNTLIEEGGATRVLVRTELQVTGRPAQFGRSIMQDVAGAMLTDFAAGVAALADEDRRSTGESGPSEAGSSRTTNGADTVGTNENPQNARRGTDPLDLTDAVRGAVGKRVGVLVVTLLFVVVIARRFARARRAP